MKAIARFFARYKYRLIVSLCFGVGMPALAYAQSTVGSSGLVPCGAVSSSNYLDFNYYLAATSCNFCYLAQLIQRIVNFLVMVTIPISVIMFAWAGILFFTNAANPKYVSRAKSIFRSVFIGFIITISGWLVVQVVLQSITNQSFYAAQSWVRLDCSEYNNNRPRQKNVSEIFVPLPASTPGQYPYPTTPSGTGATGGGTGSGPGIAAVVQALRDSCSIGDADACSQLNSPAGRTAIAAAAYQGQSTRSGPDAGNLACAWSVNNVLQSAGLPTIDNNWVPSMEQELQGGKGLAVSQSDAQPGDIVIQGNGRHVGVCQNAGCTSVLSNSSSNASFSRVSDVNFGTSQPSRIYRVVPANPQS